MLDAIAGHTTPGSPEEDFGDFSSSPWGDEEVVEHILANLAGICTQNVASGPTLGPFEGQEALRREVSTPIYTGSKQSRLHYTIWALSYQVKNKMSNAAVDELLRNMATNIAPQGPDIVRNMPLSRYEARKVISMCGLDYITIHCCPCDETIYYGDRSELLRCPRCNRSRYKEGMKTNNVPQKKFHYFPLAPRLQALYRSPTFSRSMK